MPQSSREIGPQEAARPLAIRFLSAVWGLLAAAAAIYYGNRLLQRLSTHPDFLFRIVAQFLIHGIQNLLTVTGWQVAGRRISRCFPRIEEALNILIPPIAYLATGYLILLLAPNQRLSFPIHIAVLFLLMLLFQVLTLRVENNLDRAIALILWIFSFQSLELISVISALAGISPEQDQITALVILSLGMTGFILFLSFLIGAVSSSWLLAKYSVRLSILRNSWINAELKRYETNVKEVTMLDVNGLVHDLKNPIAVIKGTARLIEKDAPSEKAALILKAADYMDTMVRELLMEDERHAISLEGFCDEIDRHLRPFPWGGEVSISIDPDARGALIEVNQVRFLRAILNILDNAWRSNMTTGGRGISLLVHRDAKTAEFEVLDNGPGYKGQKPMGRSGWGSTGLGLTFTRRVLSLHRGSLLIMNRTDGQRGARVVIYLPILSDPAQEPA